MLEQMLVWIIVATTVVLFSKNILKVLRGKTSGCNCATNDCALKNACQKAQLLEKNQGEERS